MVWREKNDQVGAVNTSNNQKPDTLNANQATVDKMSNSVNEVNYDVKQVVSKNDTVNRGSAVSYTHLDVYKRQACVYVCENA